MQSSATPVTQGHSFGTQHIKIINFINVVTLTNEFCKHLPSEWPDEALSAPQGTHFTVHWFTLTTKALLATVSYMQVDYHIH